MKAKFKNKRIESTARDSAKKQGLELTPRDYQNALNSQSACNLSGLINELTRVLPAIWCECDNTDDVNQHPITRLYAEQIAHLSSPLEYSKAFNVCSIQAKRTA